MRLHPITTSVLAAAAIASGLFLARPAPKPLTNAPAPASAPISDAPISALGSDGYRRLPDPSLTPGDTLPVATGDVCASGYAGKVRNVPESVKKSVYVEYKIVPKAGEHFEVDHLISLELGGSNSILNLWPEPYFGPNNAHQKDALENKLHLLVCQGKLTLPQAQSAIRTDWVAADLKYVSPSPPSKVMKED